MSRKKPGRNRWRISTKIRKINERKGRIKISLILRRIIRSIISIINGIIKRQR
jgi:hypothetical protein